MLYAIYTALTPSLQNVLLDDCLLLLLPSSSKVRHAHCWHCPQALSADFEQSVRNKRQGEQQHSPLKWKRHPCSPVVQVLEDEAEGMLGAGNAVVT